MKDLISRINKAFENRVRLGVMSILMVQDSADFNSLKDVLNLTDGNLASHISALEKAGYLVVHKTFAGKKTLTTYTATPEGRTAFNDHLEALEQLLRASQQNPGNSPA